MTYKVTAQNMIALLLFGIALFIAVGIIVWLIPRNVVDLELMTTKTEYRQGDIITTKNTFTAYDNAQSRYDSRIVCRNGTEQRVYIKTIDVNTTERETSISYSDFTIPDDILGHNCVLQITGSNCVNILPLLQKCIIEVNESNSFSIKEAK